MKCEKCGKEHDGSYGNGRFCSEKCKQSFNFTNSSKTHYCKFCGRGFKTPVSLGGHVVSCKLNPKCGIAKKHSDETRKRNFDISNPLEHRVLVCQRCGKTYELDIRKNDFKKGKYKHCCSIECAHSHDVSEEHREKSRKSLRKYFSEHGINITYKLRNNLSVRKPIEQPCMKICQVCNSEYKRYPFRCKGEWHSERFCSKECANKHMRKVMSDITKERCSRGEFGGKNNDTYKKHKHGWYKGIYCGSSWELAFVIWAIDNGKNIKRCELALKYEYQGRTFNYYPDFEIDGVVYEIKGFEDFKAIAKHEQYPDIIYLNKKEIKPYLKYVIDKYGKNYIDLLEDCKCQ